MLWIFLISFHLYKHRQSPLSETYEIYSGSATQKGKAGDHNTISTPFPPFVHPHLLHQCCGAEWMFVSAKMGSQGECDRAL